MKTWVLAAALIGGLGFSMASPTVAKADGRNVSVFVGNGGFGFHSGYGRGGYGYGRGGFGNGYGHGHGGFRPPYYRPYPHYGWGGGPGWGRPGFGYGGGYGGPGCW